MKPSKRDTPLALAPAKSRVIYQPLGTVCIMGAWNFPFVTTLLPLVSCISAGNCALLKPSEMSPESSSTLRKLIENYLDNECIKIVEGGAEISIACSQKKWDKICFTGSSEKGKLVAQAAAKNLVPCLLELGGKCISIVDESADATTAAAKIITGRTLNSGQICICPDYAFVHESKKDEFAKAVVDAIKNMYGEDPQKNEFYSRIVNEFHTKRVHDMTKNHGGKILCGGTVDLKDRYVAPTVIEAPSFDSAVMKEEIFGPVLPFVIFKKASDVIDHLNRSEKPLAMYYFGATTSNPNKEMFENEVQAGMMTTNDVLLQGINPDLPFGGVGFSGQGSYGGRDGFYSFSNAKALMVKPALTVKAIDNIIFPPYSATDQKIIRFLMGTPLWQSQLQKVLLFLGLAFVLMLAYKFGFLGF